MSGRCVLRLGAVDDEEGEERQHVNDLRPCQAACYSFLPLLLLRVYLPFVFVPPPLGVSIDFHPLANFPLTRSCMVHRGRVTTETTEKYGSLFCSNLLPVSMVRVRRESGTEGGTNGVVDRVNKLKFRIGDSFRKED